MWSSRPTGRELKSMHRVTARIYRVHIPAQSTSVHASPLTESICILLYIHVETQLSSYLREYDTTAELVFIHLRNESITASVYVYTYTPLPGAPPSCACGPRIPFDFMKPFPERPRRQTLSVPVSGSPRARDAGRRKKAKKVCAGRRWDAGLQGNRPPGCSKIFTVRSL